MESVAPASSTSRLSGVFVVPGHALPPHSSADIFQHREIPTATVLCGQEMLLAYPPADKKILPYF